MRKHLRRFYPVVAAVVFVGLAVVVPVRADTVVGATVREGTWMAIAVSPDASRVVIDLQGEPLGAPDERWHGAAHHG